MKTKILFLGLGMAAALACSDSSGRYEGMPSHVEQRHLALEGAPNFRDLGGYPTEDGRSVKWGLFYRSDNLHGLTDADLERLSRLGIRLVCDFRSAAERADEPDRLPEIDTPAVAELDIWDQTFSTEHLRAKLRTGEIHDMDLGQLLVKGNRLFASRFAPVYARMFELIRLPENLPVVVHCTAGKDRAGFAAALILRVLGVSLETVYEDFMLTNFYMAEEIDSMIFSVRASTLFRMDEEQLRPLMGVERRYLEAAFDEIDTRYGSFDEYRREALGISDQELQEFRDMSLTASQGS
ncbi:tyrosine-protein phosphatase [Myxococcota bacterium]|nr:tyrosine-protein phosphatase [Myxococcota bacterium]